MPAAASPPELSLCRVDGAAPSAARHIPFHILVIRASVLAMAKSSAARTSTIPAARAANERRAHLLAFLADPPADVLAAAEALGRARAHYGEDTNQEIADLEAGRHSLQPKPKPRAR